MHVCNEIVYTYNTSLKHVPCRLNAGYHPAGFILNPDQSSIATGFVIISSTYCLCKSASDSRLRMFPCHLDCPANYSVISHPVFNLELELIISQVLRTLGFSFSINRLKRYSLCMILRAFLIIALFLLFPCCINARCIFLSRKVFGTYICS